MQVDVFETNGLKGMCSTTFKKLKPNTFNTRGELEVFNLHLLRLTSRRVASRSLAVGVQVDI